MSVEGNTEVELKYEIVSRAAADVYLSAPALGPFTPAGPVRSTQVEDRYVDSRDWALTRAGFAARLRRTAKGTRINLKSLGEAESAVHRRDELDGGASLAQAPADWPASSARSVVLELCGDAPLLELLTIRQLRRVRQLEAAKTRGELSIDEVEVIGDGRVLDRFQELEVELKAGDEAPLVALAADLDRDPKLRPAVRSKLERGVRALLTALPTLRDDLQARWAGAPAELLERAGVEVAPAPAPQPASPHPRRRGRRRVRPAGDAPAPQPAPEATSRAARPVTRTAGVVADDTLAEAGTKVLRFQFMKLLSTEAAARDGSMDGVHDMRVATRRMRAAWRIFGDAFKADRTRDIRRPLRTLAFRLGAVRDLDVLLDGLESYVTSLEPDRCAGLEPLRDLWRRQRHAARALLLEELDSASYRRFLEGMELFAGAGSAGSSATARPTVPHRVRDRAPSRIWDAYERLRAFEPILPWAGIETLHELRITGKWLRYSLEFFCEALGRDASGLIGRVTALQDHLGALHDADVAAKLVRDMLVARAGELSPAETLAIAGYLESREQEVANRRREFDAVWRGVAAPAFRRGLGRTVSAL